MLKHVKCAVLFLIVSPLQLFWSVPAHASTVENSDFDNYIRVIWGLVIVLGIILILYGLLRKRFSLISSSAQQEINIVEMKPLMGKKALLLVNVKGQDLLLGISGDHISHLTTFPTRAEESFEEALQTSTKKSQE